MKAWRCRACDHWLHKEAKSAAMKYNPNANGECDYYEGGKCTIDLPDKIHDNCDLIPVHVLPEAVVEQVIRTAEIVIIKPTISNLGKFKEALTALRAETGGDSDGNEQA